MSEGNAVIDLQDEARRRIKFAAEKSATPEQIDEAVKMLSYWYVVAHNHGISPAHLAAVGDVPHTVISAIMLRDLAATPPPVPPDPARMGQ